ncbi:MAG TPA: phytoene desaturase family protein [Hyphomicrobiaceae bacterium]|nr:phytoene desaturase family protein [Hyphomicrobiaceae bacterium]
MPSARPADAGSCGDGAEPLPTAIVVGGGIGGMAAALRLRSKGWAVTLIERQAELGGRAQVYIHDGFRHDAGPTIITAPFLIDELFELFGRRREDYLRLVPLAPWYRFHFHDGTTFDYGGTIEDTLAEIRRIEPRDVEGYRCLLEHSRSLYDIAFTKLATRPFDSLSMLLAQTPRLARLRADRSVWKLIARHLSNDKLRRAFSIQPLLVGGNPFTTTSIYALIHYLERRSGVFFAMGGTGALVTALRRLLAETGVIVRTATTVEKVLVERGEARGVRLADGEVIRSRVVVSNADPMHLYGHMIDREHIRLTTRAKLASRLSMGLFILYFGTRRTYPAVAHNTIWLGERYKELLADVFRNGVLADDFSLYLHRPTATDPSFAPPGCDSFYALCPVPNNAAGISWRVEGPKLRSRVIAALDRTILPGLSESITADFFVTPDDFADRFLAVEGSGFSVAPYFLQSAWFRFHNRSESIRNLHLVGAGTHPGAGIPGVLCSARIAADQIGEAAVGSVAVSELAAGIR